MGKPSDPGDFPDSIAFKATRHSSVVNGPSHDSLCSWLIRISLSAGKNLPVSLSNFDWDILPSFEEYSSL